MKKQKTVGAKLFASWIAEKGIRDEQVAMDVGSTYQLVRHWKRGTWLPSLKNALAIEKYTEGAVRCEDWMEALEE